MARLMRRALVLFLVVGVALLIVPAEKSPQTGGWLTRVGLEARSVRVARGGSRTAGALEVRYVRKGKGPTVILVHGLASSIYTWADVIGPLSERFDVVALDLPGFGGSSQPSDLSFDDGPRAVLGLMDALGISKAHIVGNSLGGAIALLLAERESSRVDRVVILDAAGFRMNPGERPFMVRVLGSESAGAFASRLPIKRALTAATLRYLIHDDTRVSEERINEYVAPLMRPGALAATHSLLASPLDRRFIADLSTIAAKTLVMWGQFDPWLPESDADRFVAAIASSRKLVLPTGHMPQEEQPAEVALRVGDFLLS